MGRVKVYYDRKGNTLTVWFDDPTKEHLCEEIGLERFNYLPKKQRISAPQSPVKVEML